MRHWMFKFLFAMAILVALPCAPVADAGYSSGRSSSSGGSRSSGSRSSSHSSRSSSSGSSRSYSSGSSSSHSSSSSGRTYSSGKGQSYSSGKGESYSSGRGASYRVPSSPGSFGSSAATAARQSQSARSPAYSSSTWRPRADYRDQQITYLRSRLNNQMYENRTLRMQQFYGSYWGRPYNYYYHDGYNPWFWMWLLDRPSYHATWVYHHHDSMDPSRYQYLLDTNADLRARVQQLEQQNIPRDPTYVPPDLPSADLMYSDQYVNAAVNPASSGGGFESDFAPVPTRRARSAWGQIFTALFWIALTALTVWGFFWLISRRQTAPASLYRPQPRDDAPPPAPIIPRMDNPLDLQIGQTLTVAIPEFASLRFKVEQILDYTTLVGDRPFLYTAYWAVARPPGQDRIVVQLRVERLPDGGMAVLALKLHDQFAYDEAFYNIVAVDKTGLFQITDDNTNEVLAEYYRPQGVLGAYTATVVPFNADDAPAASRRLQYWDYSRRTTTDHGTIDEYVIVEMEDSGHFRILLGPQIDLSAVGK